MTKNEQLAVELIAAIKKIADPNNFDALNNFECYLGHHFDEWCKKYANTPDGLVSEFKAFANMFDEQ